MQYIKIFLCSIVILAVHGYDGCISQYDNAKGQAIPKPSKYIEKCYSVIDIVQNDTKKLEKILTILMDLYADHRHLNFQRRADNWKNTPFQEVYLDQITKIIVLLDFSKDKVTYGKLFADLGGKRLNDAKKALSPENLERYQKHLDWLYFYFWYADNRKDIPKDFFSDEDDMNESDMVKAMNKIDPLSQQIIQDPKNFIENPSFGRFDVYFFGRAQFFSHYFKALGFQYDNKKSDALLDTRLYQTLYQYGSFEDMKTRLTEYESLKLRERASDRPSVGVIQLSEKDWETRKDQFVKLKKLLNIGDGRLSYDLFKNLEKLKDINIKDDIVKAIKLVIPDLDVIAFLQSEGYQFLSKNSLDDFTQIVKILKNDSVELKGYWIESFNKDTFAKTQLVIDTLRPLKDRLDKKVSLLREDEGKYSEETLVKQFISTLFYYLSQDADPIKAFKQLKEKTKEITGIEENLSMLDILASPYSYMTEEKYQTHKKVFDQLKAMFGKPLSPDLSVTIFKSIADFNMDDLTDGSFKKIQKCWQELNRANNLTTKDFAKFVDYLSIRRRTHFSFDELLQRAIEQGKKSVGNFEAKLQNDMRGILN